MPCYHMHKSAIKQHQMRQCLGVARATALQLIGRETFFAALFIKRRFPEQQEIPTEVNHLFLTSCIRALPDYGVVPLTRPPTRGAELLGKFEAF